MNCVAREIDGEETAIISSVFKIDSGLSIQEKNLYTSKTKSETRVIPIRNMHVRFTAGKEMLYIGEVSKDNYKIQGFNKDFENVMTINKSYRSRVMKDSSATVYMFMPNSTGGSFYPKSRTTWKNRKLHYKSISYMMVDKKERLWVITPEKNVPEEAGVYVDIFENGILLNTIFLDFFKEKSTTGVWVGLHLVNDKLFYTDIESECIRVYDYK